MAQARMSRATRFRIVFLLLILLLFAACLVSMSLGALSFTPAQLWQTLTGAGSRQQRLALFTIRLPRITLAALVGAALAASGVVLQSTTGNDLADPNIIGISSGSAMFVVVYIYLTNGNNYYSLPVFTIFTMPLIALVGGMAAAAMIYGLAWKRGMKPTRLLLMGIAINAAFNALIIMLQLTFDNKNFNRVLMWTNGSIWGANWNFVIAVLPPILLLCGLVLYQSRYLDAFTLGDEVAGALGVNVEQRRRALIAVAAALAAVSTSVAGAIAFVGLLAPHIARHLVGPKHKYLTATAMLFGMVLVIAADMIAKNLFAPVELHLGIVISIIGVPYFIYLMVNQ
jgi:iron complex transport system permease protein